MQHEGQATVKVWDIAVRIFHWALVAGFLISYLTEDDLLWLHVNAGYLVLGLIAFRLVWGVIGTRHARFSDFVRRPAEVRAYLRQSMRFKAPRYLGHNPAGGVMIVLLLAMLLLTSVSGLFVYGIESHAGPLAGVLRGEFYEELFEELHELTADLVLLLVLIHIAGVFYASVEHGENLVRAMITGKKRALRE